MAHAYLVEETKTQKRRLVAASAPANAIAHCAKSAFTAQRVEGPVLDALVKGGMELEHVTQPRPEGEASGTAEGTQEPAGEGEDQPKPRK